MSWRDRALPADQPDSQGLNAPPTPPAAGGWRSRAVPAQPDDYWGDVGRNAAAGLKQAPQLFKGIAKTVGQAGELLNPYVTGKSMVDMARGTPAMETQTGEAARGVANVVKEVPGAIWQGVKDTAKAGMMPFEMATGTPPGETSAGRSFRERPIGMPFNVVSTAVPLFKGAKVAAGAARTAMAGEGANVLERAGARGINKAVGVGPTIEELTPRGQNPGKVGVQIGQDLAEEGFAGKNATEAFDQAKLLADDYGAAVDKAYKEIKAQNRRFGEWPEIENPLKWDGNKSVKPFVEKAFKLEKSPYPDDATAGKWYRAAYDSLAEKANANNGFLSLDDIRDEMSHVGDLINRTGEANKGIVRKLYGELANMRDAMVEDVATSSKRPELAEALRSANKGYSKYIRMLPDIGSQSAKSAATKAGSFLKHPWDKTVDALEPQIASGLYKSGKILRKGAELADDAMQLPGKAGKAIFKRVKSVAGDRRGAMFPEPGRPRPNVKNQATVEQYKQAIQKGDDVGPIYLDQANPEVILDGNHRMQAFQDLGVEPKNVIPTTSENFFANATPRQLPMVEAGSKVGKPHALFVYEDDFGPNGAKRKIYNVFGDPNDPAVRKAGWGSSVSAERLKELGIPVTGREAKRFK